MKVVRKAMSTSVVELAYFEIVGSVSLTVKLTAKKMIKSCTVVFLAKCTAAEHFDNTANSSISE